MKECKGCNNKYDLKKSGRYCPKCGIDYWDGVCGFSKQLNKKELMINNEKFRKMNLVKIMLCFFLFINIGTAQVYYDEIAPADTSGYILVSKTDGVFDTVPFYNTLDSNCFGFILDKGLPVGIGSYCDTIYISKNIYSGISDVYNIGNLEYDADTILVSTFLELGDGLVYLSGDGTKAAPFEFALDLILNDSGTIDFTQQQTNIFTAEVDTTIIATQNYVTNNGDNLGDHIATENVQLNDKYLSNDGGNEGIRIDNTGNVGIGLINPAHTLDVYGKMNLTNAQSNVLISGGNDTGTGTANVAIGKDTYKTFTTGLKNVAIGSQALELNTTGQNNIALGYQALEANTTGNYNVAVGSRVLQNANSNYNTGIGYLAGLSATGTSNVTIGYAAGQNAVSNNTALGYQSGRNTVSGGVYIGYKSGYSETTDNKLYIENSAGTTPLIWGDFSTNDLKFWAIVEVNEDLNVNQDLDVTGKITVGDNVEGNAVNIAGYDSEDDLTRVSIGTGLSLTTGTLSATGEVQTVASARMNDITYLTTDSPSYMNVSISTENLDNGGLAVNTGLERIEVDTDAGGYYMVTVQGNVQCDSGTDQIIEYFSNTATYDYIGTLYIKDTDNQSFHLSFPILYSNNDDIILSIKSPTTPTEDITLSSVDWTITKI